MKLTDIGSNQLRKMNKLYESRFGFSIDFDSLTIPKAKRISTKLSEEINNIKKSFGMHTAEKNPRYMEILLIKEGLDRWIENERSMIITEGEVSQAQTLLAAKDIVDTVQDAIEKLSKIQNEELPALYDSIYDQIGSSQAEQYRQSVTGSMTQLISSLNAERDKLDKAARALAGEEVGQPMELGNAGSGTSNHDINNDFDLEDNDESDEAFNASDVAAGGTSEFGRERR